MSTSVRRLTTEQMTMKPKKATMNLGRRCLTKFKEQDSFNESFVMSLDDNTQLAQSYLGSICSLMILMATSLYAFQKVEVLYNKKDVDVLSAMKDLVFTD